MSSSLTAIQRVREESVAIVWINGHVVDQHAGRKIKSRGKQISSHKFVIRGIIDLIRVPASRKSSGSYIGTERAHVKVFLQEAQVSVMRQ